MTQLDEDILKELQMLRKLKMMELTEAGFPQSKMADALGVSTRTIRRLMANPKQGKDNGQQEA
ncbi:helix-turn-helix domain-containing protein [Alteriqipengyuania sp. 357]